ncbi:MAG: transporter substrate-binding domain-containing protein [Betaproteobacteria bacterium]|jgi:membrane-bound lytic murein transglycosylase MltF|nr:MAG: transporter substrate-binding domain-containing protein [Betaproteobacteria bacterium]
MLHAPQRYGAHCVAALLAAASLCAAPAGAQEKAAAPAKPRQLSLENEPWTGDFDQMLERRIIRVLAPYSRTLYYVDKGHERGITASLVREFERYVNRRYAKQLGNRPLTVILIPSTRDKLLPGLAEGRGDIAAGNLTETEERLKVVDFVAPQDRKPVRELIVTGPASPELATLDDLSGKTVHVRKASSYYESLVALNARLTKERKAPVKLVELPDALEDEDALEMLAAGLFELAVVDDWKALLWARILPKIKVREDLVLRDEGHTGWAIRKGSPKLEGVLTDFYRGVVKRQGVIESRLAEQQRRVKHIRNNTAGAEWKRFQATVRLFEKYGARYSFDPLMLTAQGYQESRLRQDARSHAGAIGVMQIMPDTGNELRVGDIHELEPNIHGGAKYMNQLMTRYFADANFSEHDRTLFAFASYNAGPGAISRMRGEAAKGGLDPDKWFDNVEVVVGRRIGVETTTYVRNIFKYYVAYKLALDAQEAARTAREKVAPR